MWYRIYGVFVVTIGCWMWWFASPPVDKQPGIWFLLCIGGFAAILTGTAVIVGGKPMYQTFRNLQVDFDLFSHTATRPKITLTLSQAQYLLPLAEKELAEAVKQKKLADQDGRMECYGVEDWQYLVDTLSGKNL